MECLRWLMERKTPPVQVAEGHKHLGHKQEYVGCNNQLQLAQDKNSKAVPCASSVCLGCIFGGDLGILHFSRKHNRSMQDTRSEQLVSHIFQRHLEGILPFIVLPAFALVMGGWNKKLQSGYALPNACQDCA